MYTPSRRSRRFASTAAGSLCALVVVTAAEVPPATKAEGPSGGGAVPPVAAGVARASRVGVMRAASPGAAAVSQWTQIQEHGYEARGLLFAGLRQLEAEVDDRLEDLTVKRAYLASRTDTRDWDFRMEEMWRARSYLRGMREELGQADAASWEQRKRKVGEAWVRAQEAIANVGRSTTL